MSDDLLEALLNPNDDHAWKIAVGHAINDIREQVKTTNGRVTRLEMWRVGLAGGLATLTAGMPFLLWLIQRAAGS